ncbi:hypothetical protein RUM44_001580 [Polyplax serrata]|uniref:Uncharacterized protein n=1 Tax=Polyplax serrata TaxID=468196 RepID=A0ABR1AKF8_POLSC
MDHEKNAFRQEYIGSDDPFPVSQSPVQETPLFPYCISPQSTAGLSESDTLNRFNTCYLYSLRLARLLKSKIITTAIFPTSSTFRVERIRESDDMPVRLHENCNESTDTPINNSNALCQSQGANNGNSGRYMLGTVYNWEDRDRSEKYKSLASC